MIRVVFVCINTDIYCQILDDVEFKEYSVNRSLKKKSMADVLELPRLSAFIPNTVNCPQPCREPMVVPAVPEQQGWELDHFLGGLRSVSFILVIPRGLHLHPEKAGSLDF